MCARRFRQHQALAGLSPWIAWLRGSAIGPYTTVNEARVAVEAVALAAGYELAG